MKQIAVITSLESSVLHKSWYVFSVWEVTFLSLYSAEQQEYLLLYFSFHNPKAEFQIILQFVWNTSLPVKVLSEVSTL